MSKEDSNIPEQKVQSETQKLMDEFLSRPDFNNVDWNELDERPQNQGITLAWQAVDLAFIGHTALLEKLLSCSQAILEEIDWNACPKDEKHISRGVTVAWQAASLANKGQPALLEKLLACSPAILKKIDWNACPQDAKRIDRGATLAVTALILDVQGQPALLEKLLACSPDILEKIDWNACLKDEKHISRGVTVAWQAVDLAHKGQPALLEKLLACSPDILEKIDWNACPQDAKRIDRGATLAVTALILDFQGQPALLEKLLACSPDILEKIDWNACLMDEVCPDRGVTIAWNATFRAYEKGQSALLEKLLACSPAILEKIDWNACPKDEKHIKRGVTVAWQAACFACLKRQPALLEKLLACSPAILEKIDWNACPKDEKHGDRHLTLAGCASLLAFHGQTALLEKLLSRSPAILENIDWCSERFMNRPSPVSLLRTVITQNNARLFFLLLEWSAPALQNLKTALLLGGLTATDTTSKPLLCWIDFSLLVNPQKKPATQSLLTPLDEEEKCSEEKSIPDADEIEKVLENIKVLPDLHGRACLHTVRQWPCLRQRFYSVILLESPDYGTAQWELANMYMNERDEKEIPAERESRLKKALYAASRCWFHDIRMSPDSTEEQGRPLVQMIVKAILGWPPGEFTRGLPAYVESLLNEDAQYYTTHRKDLRLQELDLKITNLWLSLKIFLNEEKNTAMMKLITELQKYIVIDGNPHQSDQKETGQNRTRTTPQADLPGLFSSTRLGLLPDNSHSSTDSSSSHSGKKPPT